MINTSNTHSNGGNLTVDTDKIGYYSIGTNDFGQALNNLDDVQMTAEENAGFFEADDVDNGNHAAMSRWNTLCGILSALS